MVEFSQCEIIDDHGRIHSIRDLTRRHGFIMRTSVIQSATVQCYTAVIDSHGKLVNSGSHVAVLVDNKVNNANLMLNADDHNFKFRLSMPN